HPQPVRRRALLRRVAAVVAAALVPPGRPPGAAGGAGHRGRADVRVPAVARAALGVAAPAGNGGALMPRRLPLSVALLVGLAGIGQAVAQELPPTPAGSIAAQRLWLLQQVRIGEATGRQRLIEDALARLRLLAPDDRTTMVA